MNAGDQSGKKPRGTPRRSREGETLASKSLRRLRSDPSRPRTAARDCPVGMIDMSRLHESAFSRSFEQLKAAISRKVGNSAKAVERDLRT